MGENEFLSVSEWSKKYGKDRATTLRLIYDKRISAVKIGNQWAIPSNTEPPPDKRVKSGKYRNWRKPKNQEQDNQQEDKK